MLEKLKNLQLNIFQNLALVGLVASSASHVGLALMHKQVDSFWAVYVVWAGVLILSTLIRIDVPHHDHHHDHDHS
jgi:hypothetical protein